jgi:predicted CXXCH cytochrome family protein
MKNAFRGFVLAVLTGVWLLFPHGGIRSGPYAQTANKESCITDTCHSSLGKEKFVHGPVATGDCAFCHKPLAKHKFEPIKDVAELCYSCHDKLNTQKSVHRPVSEGKCTQCHDPHQSPNKFQLKEAGYNLCFRCHDKKIAEGKFVHGPVSVGDCRACHQPHQSKFKKILVADGNNLCFSCHADMAEEIKKHKNIHSPVEMDCINCHSPHSGAYKYMFSLDPQSDLCLNCHTAKKQELTDSTVRHGAVGTGKKCLVCHNPHYSNYSKLLMMEPADLCLSCHDREYTKESYTIADMKTFLSKNPDKHGPIRDNDCTSCHNAHGSKNFRLLQEPFPPVFYAPYDASNYKLCFMCHEPSIAAEEKTTTMTGFRNGDQNLHFVHVNKQKGRTCRACHDAHATNNPKHIRDSVPFGTWSIPINFMKTQTGGQCTPGCHQLFRYDRDKPFANRLSPEALKKERSR